MLCSCTHMATVGVKGNLLITNTSLPASVVIHFIIVARTVIWRRSVQLLQTADIEKNVKTETKTTLTQVVN